MQDSIEHKMTEDMLEAVMLRLRKLQDELESLPWWAWYRRYETTVRIETNNHAAISLLESMRGQFSPRASHEKENER